MTTYDNTNSGVLFKNTNKNNQNSPDYQGEINVDGIEKKLSAWVQTSASGTRYLKLKCRDPKPAQDDNAAAPSQPAPAPAPSPAPAPAAPAPTPPQQAMPQDGPIDDDIPF